MAHAWLEAVVALPDQLFYNSGISTYFCVVTNRKSPERRGKVQLVAARDSWQKMRKSLGEKGKELSDDHIAEITKLYGAFEDSERVKIPPNESLGFHRVTVERPLRLRWEVTDATLASVRADKRIAKLHDDVVEGLVSSLGDHLGLSERERTTVAKVVDPLLRTTGLSAPQQKAVWEVLAVRDPEAAVITNREGEPEPDPELRRPENVALPGTRVQFRVEGDQLVITAVPDLLELADVVNAPNDVRGLS